MKKRSNISYLSYAFMTLTFMGAVTACVNEDEFCTDSIKQTTKEGLSVLPAVGESDVVLATTRAASIDSLKEKDLNTLDVFVEHIANGTGEGTFLKQYHLVSTEQNKIKESDINKLADRWRHEGLQEGEKYNIYVAANNPLTKEDVASVAALKALTYKESLKLDNANNVDWAATGDTVSGNIYKTYNAAPGSYRALTSHKEFMMDGVIKNWTPDPTSQTQTFDVTMKRAAAKIVLNLKFDADFLKSLTHTKKTVDGVVTWEEKPAAERVTITGTPAWRYYNFAFGAPVFTPEEAGDGVELHNSGVQLREKYGYEGDDKHHTIITYSYPNNWEETPTARPSLVISVGYTEGTGDAATTTYNYYRIPIVPKDTTSLNRNTIYVIDAKIATRGSESHEDVTEMDNLVYEVANWNDKSNNDAIHNEVESVQHMYLKVNPVVYTLHGDGDQSLIINYQKATGTEVGYKVFNIASDGTKGAAVEPTANNAVWAWYYDKNGNFKTTYGSGTTAWSHLKVTFQQSSEGINDSKGTINVTSTALDNRAIKYILLRVYLKDNPDLYEDVLIRHFPTDNIQSITGQWSSYHTGASTAEVTWDPVAAGWAEGTYSSREVEVNSTDPYERSEVKYDGTPSNHDSGDYRYNYSTGQDGSTVQTQYRNNVSQGVNRYNTNGESNAALGADGYWYWGDTRMNGSNNNYDWRGNNGTGGMGSTRYRWTNYYRSQYKKTHYYRTQYYRIVAVVPETGNWVDWDRDHNNSGTAKTVQRSDSRFHAHVWIESDNHVHNISSTNNNMAYDSGTQSGSGHTNNHMYVIQISSTSSKYVLGKPVLGNPGPYQSLDEVVSPAFMIASQLGVVSTGWDAASAAEHCSRYMEVGTDGTRYAGWRLPTDDEIGVISDYQNGIFGNITIPANDRVMDGVLKGSHYFNLSGGTTASNWSGTGGSSGNYLRCIRELSAEEIEKLNGFDALIEKYQKR